eukprot:3538735-Rhodomonas_salina.1
MSGTGIRYAATRPLRDVRYRTRPCCTRSREIKSFPGHLVLGMKSYGRSSAFLLKIGHDQVGATSLRDARYCGAIWLCYAQY